jgi:hypothetical protein
MTTTGSTLFNLDFTEIAEEAWERAGREMRSGYDLRTARRSMNLMTIEWQNKGINMWTMEQGFINLTPGLSTYALPTDTIDLLEHVIRTGQNTASTQADLTITRISISTYATIPNKLQQARPIQMWFQRLDGQTTSSVTTLSAGISATDTTISVTSAASLPATGYLLVGTETIYYGYISGNTLYSCFRGQQDTTAASHTSGATVYLAQVPAITVWPTPDSAQQYTFVYWRLRRTQDAGGGVNVMDVPFRFIPCMAAGLAYYIASKIPEGAERIMLLKQQYDEAWELAAYEDHEKAALRFVPRQQFIGNTI